MSETETTSASNGVTAAEPKKKRKVAAKKKPAKRSAKATAKKSGKGKGAKAKSGKTSFVIWVDKKQGEFIKRKAAAAKMSQADYFRRALKLPASK